MPLSNWLHLPIVMHYVIRLRPQRLLDVGVGFGAYGVLTRQYLDAGYGRYAKPDWALTVDGVEVHAPYRNPVWDYAYNQVRLGDVAAVLPELSGYDLILCLDVIEHFELAGVRRLSERLLEVADIVVYTTPAENSPQGACFGNPAEMHRSHVQGRDLAGVVACHAAGATRVYVCALKPAAVARVLTAARTAPVVMDPARCRSLRAWRWLVRIGRGLDRRVRALLHRRPALPPPAGSGG